MHSKIPNSASSTQKNHWRTNPKHLHKLQHSPNPKSVLSSVELHSMEIFRSMRSFGFFVPLSVFFGNKTGLIFGRTPPPAIVTPASNFPISSSFLIANRTCLGMILYFLLSLAAFPANSRTCKSKNLGSTKWRFDRDGWGRRGKTTIRLPQRLNTPSLRPSRRGRRHWHAERIFRSSDNERHGRRGTVVRLWRSEKLPSSSRLLFFHLRLS